MNLETQTRVFDVTLESSGFNEKTSAIFFQKLKVQLFAIKIDRFLIEIDWNPDDDLRSLVVAKIERWPLLCRIWPLQIRHTQKWSCGASTYWNEKFLKEMANDSRETMTKKVPAEFLKLLFLSPQDILSERVLLIFLKYAAIPAKSTETKCTYCRIDFLSVIH